jgi:hypothetical protein
VPGRGFQGFGHTDAIPIPRPAFTLVSPHPPGAPS